MKIEIIRADTSDANQLTNITIESKSYWKYPPQYIKDWIKELTISYHYIKKNAVYNLFSYTEGRILGYYAYFIVDERTVKLDNLFLKPEWIGKGYGKILMDDFLERVKSTGFEKVILDSDPHTEEFYKKFGFVTIGQLPTTIENRFLPIMELNL